MNISKYRIFNNKTQSDIANILNISLSTYRNLEIKDKNQLRYKDIKRIEKLADYYNINVNQLIN